MFYIYILYSKTFDRYYVGSSEDPWRRLSAHNESERNTYTSKYRPWELKGVFKAGSTRAEAMRMEKYIKRQRRAMKQSKLASWP